MAIGIPNNGKPPSLHVHRSPINGLADGEHDILTEQIRTTEGLNAIMGLGSMTSVV
jgi:hypothetical protein